MSQSPAVESLVEQVSVERQARQHAEEEEYWELARCESIGHQLRQIQLETADEEKYWALRRQTSFGVVLPQLAARPQQLRQSERGVGEQESMVDTTLADVSLQRTLGKVAELSTIDEARALCSLAGVAISSDAVGLTEIQDLLCAHFMGEADAKRRQASPRAKSAGAGSRTVRGPPVRQKPQAKKRQPKGGHNRAHMHDRLQLRQVQDEIEALRSAIGEGPPHPPPPQHSLLAVEQMVAPPPPTTNVTGAAAVANNDGQSSSSSSSNNRRRSAREQAREARAYQLHETLMEQQAGIARQTSFSTQAVAASSNLPPATAHTMNLDSLRRVAGEAGKHAMKIGEELVQLGQTARRLPEGRQSATTNGSLIPMHKEVPKEDQEEAYWQAREHRVGSSSGGARQFAREMNDGASALTNALQTGAQQMMQQSVGAWEKYLVGTGEQESLSGNWH